MPKGKHGEIIHNDTLILRIDANLKERFKLCCADDGVGMPDQLRLMMVEYVGDRHPMGHFTELIRKWGEPTDERDADRAHRPEPDQQAFTSAGKLKPGLPPSPSAGGGS